MIKFYFNCLLTNTAYSVHFYLDNVNIIAGIDEGFKKLTAFRIVSYYYVLLTLVAYWLLGRD